jgi:hypothetical protein
LEAAIGIKGLFSGSEHECGAAITANQRAILLGHGRFSLGLAISSVGARKIGDSISLLY